MSDFEFQQWNKNGVEKYHGKEKTVHVPEGITEIGRLAFEDNKEVIRVILPASLETIRQYAFIGCSNLTEVVVQGALREIADGAFKKCTNLEKIAIPETTRVARYAFDGCPKMKKGISEGSEKEFRENEHVKAWLREHNMDKMRRIFSLCVYHDEYRKRQMKAHDLLLSSAEEDRQSAALYVLIAAALANEHDSDPDYFPLDKACVLFAQFDLEEDCTDLGEDLEEEMDFVTTRDLIEIVTDRLFGI